MEVSGQLHAPAALPPEKELPKPIGEEAGWASEPEYNDLLRRNTNTTKKYETLWHSSKEVSLEINAEKMKYTYVSVS